MGRDSLPRSACGQQTGGGRSVAVFVTSAHAIVTKRVCQKATWAQSGVHSRQSTWPLPWPTANRCQCPEHKTTCTSCKVPYAHAHPTAHTHLSDPSILWKVLRSLQEPRHACKPVANKAKVSPNGERCMKGEKARVRKLSSMLAEVYAAGSWCTVHVFVGHVR